ncbi:hypothetical protein BGZ83_008852, partial [Gryganskiella cystojenkinii]
MVKVTSYPRPASVLALVLLSIALSSAVPVLQLRSDALSLNSVQTQLQHQQQQSQQQLQIQQQQQKTLKRRTVRHGRSLALIKRAPLPPAQSSVDSGPSDVTSPVVPPPTEHQASPTTNPPPVTTTDTPPPPVTTAVPTTEVPPTTKPPVTTTERPPPETTTQPRKTSTTDAPSPDVSPTVNPGHTRSPSGKPTGPNNPGGSQPSNSTATPTNTPTNGTNPNDTDKSSGPPILPIVLGTILGLGALIGAGVFFFFRFRKHRRFDSKRPLSFLALSMDDPSMSSTNHESASARGGSGMDGDLYDVNRPITSQPSLRYTPPVMSGLFGGAGEGHANRYSYQSSSEYSGATGAQFAQWSQDDENASLVGGRSQPVDFADDLNPAGDRPVSEQSFVATSMVPMMALNSQRHLEHARYNRPTALENDAVIVPRQPQGIPSSSPPTSPVLARATTPVVRSGVPHLLDQEENAPTASGTSPSSSPVP